MQPTARNKADEHHVNNISIYCKTFVCAKKQLITSVFTCNQACQRLIIIIPFSGNSPHDTLVSWCRVARILRKTYSLTHCSLRCYKMEILSGLPLDKTNYSNNERGPNTFFPTVLLMCMTKTLQDPKVTLLNINHKWHNMPAVHFGDNVQKLLLLPKHMRICFKGVINFTLRQVHPAPSHVYLWHRH